MSPQSNFWTGFVNSETYKAQYSIALARVTPLSVHATPVVGSAVPSNITFGSANDAHYYGMDSMNVTALSNYSYAISNFSFGIVYQTNGADSSEYFFDLGVQMNPITFTTNFVGLGLPASLYSQVATLLVDISNNEVVCDSTLDGICVMPQECAAYTSFEDYTFKFNMAGSDNYIRVPLAAFAQNVKGSGGVALCNIEITYLDPLATQSNNIILGGMFFQEFFGVFTNTYNVDPATQEAAFFVNENAMYNAYVGNEVLPTGQNPFVPAPTPTPEPEKGNAWIWITILSILVVLLLGGLGFAIYKWKANQSSTANKRELTYNSDDQSVPLANNASDDL